MPLTPDSVIQNTSGSFVGASGTATLAATTAGNTVILIVTGTAGAPGAAGFTLITGSTISPVTGRIWWKNTAGGETSFALTGSASQVYTWVCYEIEGLDQSNPVDVTGGFSTATTSNLTTNTAAASTFDGMVLVFHACEDLTSPTPGTWSGHTGGLSELTEVGGNDGTISLGLSVSLAFTYTAAPATWQCTATKTVAAGQAALANIVVFTSAAAKYVANPDACTGFEFGFAGGLALGGGAGVSGKLFDDAVGSPEIITTNPRSGTYCLELSASAAAESVAWYSSGGTTTSLMNVTSQCITRVSFYFPTSLPGADLVLLSLTPHATPADLVVVRYESADSTIGVKVGTGTEVFSDAAVVADQWISLDLRIDGRTTTHLCDWSLDYDDDGNRTVQTQAAGTCTVNATGWAVRLGWTAASTGTVRYDDWVVSAKGGHYPLGNMEVLAITPDPAGTVVLSGTSTNFQTFTGNGSTMTAWNATTARNNIDEVPPTISASADGFAQVLTATSDYVEIPMTSIVAVDMGAAIRGVRMVACGWAASTTTATIGFHAYDGTTDHTLQGAADLQFDNSTSTPAWFAKMVRALAGRIDWTQTKLDALTFRVGYSGDASPAIGIHNIIGEVCLRIGDLVEVISVEGGFYVHWRMDPDSSGVIQAIVTTPPGAGAFYSVTVGGSPIEVEVPPDTVHTEYIGATDISTVTEQSLIPHL